MTLPKVRATKRLKWLIGFIIAVLAYFFISNHTTQKIKVINHTDTPKYLITVTNKVNLKRFFCDDYEMRDKVLKLYSKDTTLNTTIYVGTGVYFWAEYYLDLEKIR